MNKQTPNAVLLIDPLHFGYNLETAQSHFLQQPSDLSDKEVSELARKEQLSLVNKLKAKGIKVIFIADDEQQVTKSSVFSSSWISFHEDSRIVAYPIEAQSRKLERRGDLLNAIVDDGFPIYDIVDISTAENEGKFVHGTESLVFDRVNKVVYAAVCSQTDASVVDELAKRFGYFPVTFSVTLQHQGRSISNLPTNLILSIADTYALISLEAFENEDERDFVTKVLQDCGKEIVEITSDQVLRFAGNAIQLESVTGKKILLISKQAYESLQENQIKLLKSHNEILIADISVIEYVGGASISSMVAGIFLPK